MSKFRLLKDFMGLNKHFSKEMLEGIRKARLSEAGSGALVGSAVGGTIGGVTNVGDDNSSILKGIAGGALAGAGLGAVGNVGRSFVKRLPRLETIQSGGSAKIKSIIQKRIESEAPASMAKKELYKIDNSLANKKVMTSATYRRKKQLQKTLDQYRGGPVNKGLTNKQLGQKYLYKPKYNYLTLPLNKVR